MSTDYRVAETSPRLDLPATSDAPDVGVVLEIEALGEAHRAWAARLHVAELPHGLFPRLGHRFVARWHRAHTASPHGVGFVALQAGVPVGFALASTDRRANVDWLLSHRRGPLVRSAAAALARRPREAAWFLRTRGARYLRRLTRRAVPATSPVTAASPGAVPSVAPGAAGVVAVLEAIVVVPEARAHGVGSRLVERFLTCATQAGADRAELVTHDGVQGAAGFYENTGWVQIGRHLDRDGTAVLTYRTELPPPQR